MMAGGPGASEAGSPALGWGRDEGRRRGHWPQGTGSQQASTSRLPLSSFEVMSGKEGRTWVTVCRGDICREKGVRCESRRAAWGPAGTSPRIAQGPVSQEESYGGPGPPVSWLPLLAPVCGCSDQPGKWRAGSLRGWHSLVNWYQR